MSKRWLERSKAAIRWVVVFATVAVLFRVGTTYGSDLKAIDLNFELSWLITSAVATTAANLLLPLGWRRIVISFDQVLSASRAVRLWCLAQSARYLPTGLVAVASRLQLAAKAGISRSITASSIAIETAVLFGWALLTCVIFVPSTTLPQATRWLAGLSCALGLVASPWLVPLLSQRLSLVKRLSLPPSHPRRIAEGVGLLGASVAARAIGTTCLAMSFLNLTSNDIPLIVGASYAGVAAGMVGITPAGLGVREGVIAAVLASRFGLAEASAFALVSRAWEFGFEMAFLGAASWWGRDRQQKHGSSKDSSIPQAKL
mgnify:FL=1